MPRKPQKGRVIRVGQEVYAMLQKRKRDKESWNKLLKRMFGISESKRTYWILEKAKLIFNDEKEARGMSIVLAVQDGKKKAEKPIKVQETK